MRPANVAVTGLDDGDALVGNQAALARWHGGRPVSMTVSPTKLALIAALKKSESRVRAPPNGAAGAIRSIRRIYRLLVGP